MRARIVRTAAHVGRRRRSRKTMNSPTLGLQFGMRVIAVKTLRTFWAKHPDAEQSLLAWYDEASNAGWKQPSDIKRHYANASILKNRRVVFNIKGNDYRLIVAVAYKVGVVYVKFIGTHRQYDAVDAETVEMG